VVITGHEGLAFEEALEVARQLTRVLVASGAAAPMDPLEIVSKLGGKNPEAVRGRARRALADLAHAPPTSLRW